MLMSIYVYVSSIYSFCGNKNFQELSLIGIGQAAAWSKQKLKLHPFESSSVSAGFCCNWQNIEIWRKMRMWLLRKMRHGKKQREKELKKPGLVCDRTV